MFLVNNENMGLCLYITNVYVEIIKLFKSQSQISNLAKFLGRSKKDNLVEFTARM